MIYKENDESNPAGHNPKVSNEAINSSKNNTWLSIFLSVITLGLFGIYFISCKMK